MRYKAIPVAVNGLNFGKTIISKGKGVRCDLKNLNFFTYLAENVSILYVYKPLNLQEMFLVTKMRTALK